MEISVRKVREECKEKVCGKKRHTKTEIRSEMSDLISGRIAAGENYNLTRDTLEKLIFQLCFIYVRKFEKISINTILIQIIV